MAEQESSRTEFLEIQQLNELDKIVCNSQNLDNIDGVLKQYEKNSNTNMKIKAKLQFSGLNAAGQKRAKKQQNIFLIRKKGTIIEKP